MRQGEIPHDLLSLASLCGHQGAIALTTEEEAQDLPSLLSGLWELGVKFLFRAAVSSLIELDPERGFPAEEAQILHQLVRDFLLRSLRVNRANLIKAETAAQRLLMSERTLRELIAISYNQDLHLDATICFCRGVLLLSETRQYFSQVVRLKSRIVDVNSEETRKWLNQNLIPWALGYGDPLLDRARELGFDI
jgi:hypothetical protein